MISDLIDAIHPFSQRYPQITVGIDIRGTNDIVRTVLEDRAHIGIVFYTAPNPLLRVHRSSVQPLYAVATPDHPLARAKRPISLEELARHKLALPDTIEGIFSCPNSNCISHNEPVTSFFYVKPQARDTKMKCKYCEKVFSRDIVAEVR
ncbi:hypothetical protein C3F00_040030 [Pseudomonas sp. MWU13-2860]|nr:hypothetical protein C3F00_040030 [Pseudomonas sp. MWU13-2860]